MPTVPKLIYERHSKMTQQNIHVSCDTPNKDHCRRLMHTTQADFETEGSLFSFPANDDGNDGWMRTDSTHHQTLEAWCKHAQQRRRGTSLSSLANRVSSISSFFLVPFRPIGFAEPNGFSFRLRTHTFLIRIAIALLYLLFLDSAHFLPDCALLEKPKGTSLAFRFHNSDTCFFAFEPRLHSRHATRIERPSRWSLGSSLLFAEAAATSLREWNGWFYSTNKTLALNYWAAIEEKISTSSSLLEFKGGVYEDNNVKTTGGGIRVTVDRIPPSADALTTNKLNALVPLSDIAIIVDGCTFVRSYVSIQFIDWAHTRAEGVNVGGAYALSAFQRVCISLTNNKFLFLGHNPSEAQTFNGLIAFGVFVNFTVAKSGALSTPVTLMRLSGFNITAKNLVGFTSAPFAVEAQQASLDAYARGETRSQNASTRPSPPFSSRQSTTCDRNTIRTTTALLRIDIGASTSLTKSYIDIADCHTNGSSVFQLCSEGQQHVVLDVGSGDGGGEMMRRTMFAEALFEREKMAAVPTAGGSENDIATTLHSREDAAPRESASASVILSHSLRRSEVYRPANLEPPVESARADTSTTIERLAASTFLNNTITIFNVSARPLFDTDAVVEYAISDQTVLDNVFEHTSICIERAHEEDGKSNGFYSAGSTNSYGGHAFGLCEHEDGSKMQGTWNEVTGLVTLPTAGNLNRPSPVQRGGALAVYFSPCVQEVPRGTFIPATIPEGPERRLQSRVSNTHMSNSRIRGGPWSREVVSLVVASFYVDTSLISATMAATVGQVPQEAALLFEGNSFVNEDIAADIMSFPFADGDNKGVGSLRLPAFESFSGAAVNAAVAIRLETATRMRHRSNVIASTLACGYSGAGTEYRNNVFSAQNCSARGMFVRAVNFSVVVIDVDPLRSWWSSPSSVVDSFMSGELAERGMMSNESFVSNKLHITSTQCRGTTECIGITVNGKVKDFSISVADFNRFLNATNNGFRNSLIVPNIVMRIFGSVRGSRISLQNSNFEAECMAFALLALHSNTVFSANAVTVSFVSGLVVSQGRLISVTTVSDYLFDDNRFNMARMTLESSVESMGQILMIQHYSLLASNIAAASQKGLGNNTFLHSQLHLKANGDLGSALVLNCEINPKHVQTVFVITDSGYSGINAKAIRLTFAEIATDANITIANIYGSSERVYSATSIVNFAVRMTLWGFKNSAVSVRNVSTASQGVIMRLQSTVTSSTFDVTDITLNSSDLSVAEGINIASVSCIAEKNLAVYNSSFVIRRIAFIPQFGNPIDSLVFYYTAVLFVQHTRTVATSAFVLIINSSIVVTDVSIDASLIAPSDIRGALLMDRSGGGAGGFLASEFEDLYSDSKSVASVLSAEKSSVKLGGDAVSLFQRQATDEDSDQWNPNYARTFNTTVLIDGVFGGVDVSLRGEAHNKIVIRRAIGVRQQYVANGTAKGKARVKEQQNTSNTFSFNLVSRLIDGTAAGFPASVPAVDDYFGPTRVIIERIFNYALFAITGDRYEGVVMQVMHVNCSYDQGAMRKTLDQNVLPHKYFGDSDGHALRVAKGYGFLVNVSAITKRAYSSSSALLPPRGGGGGGDANANNFSSDGLYGPTAFPHTVLQQALNGNGPFDPLTVRLLDGRTESVCCFCDETDLFCDKGWGRKRFIVHAPNAFAFPMGTPSLLYFSNVSFTSTHLIGTMSEGGAIVFSGGYTSSRSSTTTSSSSSSSSTRRGPSTAHPSSNVLGAASVTHTLSDTASTPSLLFSWKGLVKGVMTPVTSNVAFGLETGGVVTRLSAENCTSAASCLLLFEHCLFIKKSTVRGWAIAIKSRDSDDSATANPFGPQQFFFGPFSMLQIHQCTFAQQTSFLSLSAGAIRIDDGAFFQNLSTHFSLLFCYFKQLKSHLVSLNVEGALENANTIEIWGNVFSEGGMNFTLTNANTSILFVNNSFIGIARAHVSGVLNGAQGSLRRYEGGAIFAAGCNLGNSVLTSLVSVFGSGRQVGCELTRVDGEALPRIIFGSMDEGVSTHAFRCGLTTLSFFSRDTPRVVSIVPPAWNNELKTESELSRPALLPQYWTQVPCFIQAVDDADFTASRALTSSVSIALSQTTTSSLSLTHATQTLFLLSGTTATRAANVVFRSRTMTLNETTLQPSLPTTTIITTTSSALPTTTNLTSFPSLTATPTPPQTSPPIETPPTTNETPTTTSSVTTTDMATTPLFLTPAPTTNTTNVTELVETLRPIPAPLANALESSSSAAGVVLAMSSVVSVNGGQLGVANAMLRLTQCNEEEGDGSSNEDESLPILVHPLQFSFGGGGGEEGTTTNSSSRSKKRSQQKRQFRLARQYAAAALSNTVIIPLIASLFVVGPLSFLVAKIRNGGGRSSCGETENNKADNVNGNESPRAAALSSIGWPSLLILPFATLGEGIGVSIVKSLSGRAYINVDGDSADAIDGLSVAMGVIALLVTTAFICAWVFVLVRKLPRRSLRLVPPPSSSPHTNSDESREKKEGSVDLEAGEGGEDTSSRPAGGAAAGAFHHPSNYSLLARVKRALAHLTEPMLVWAPLAVEQQQVAADQASSSPPPPPLPLSSDGRRGGIEGHDDGDELSISIDDLDVMVMDANNNTFNNSNNSGDVSLDDVTRAFDGNEGAEAPPTHHHAEMVADTNLIFDEEEAESSDDDDADDDSPPSLSPSHPSNPTASRGHGSAATKKDTNSSTNNANNYAEGLQLLTDLERYGNAIGDKRFYVAELVSFLCSLLVGVLEGVAPSTSGGCQSRAVFALGFATLQCACSLTAVVPIELAFQILLSICVVPLSILVTAQFFDDANSNDSSAASSSSSSPMSFISSDRVANALATLSTVGNVVGILLMLSGLLIAVRNMLVDSRGAWLKSAQQRLLRPPRRRRSGGRNRNTTSPPSVAAKGRGGGGGGVLVVVVANETSSPNVRSSSLTDIDDDDVVLNEPRTATATSTPATNSNGSPSAPLPLLREASRAAVVSPPQPLPSVVMMPASHHRGERQDEAHATSTQPQPFRQTPAAHYQRHLMMGVGGGDDALILSVEAAAALGLSPHPVRDTADQPSSSPPLLSASSSRPPPPAWQVEMLDEIDAIIEAQQRMRQKEKATK